MKLLLTSGGISNNSIAKALRDLTGKDFAELNLAFVPTAANVERGDKDWLIEDLKRAEELGFKQVDIVDISALPRDMWLPRLEEADVIMFEGGNTFHLMREINRTGLDQELPRLLESRVYVGISAGSMVACKSLDLSQSERLYSEKVEHENDRGLGYVDIIFRPHLNSEYFPNVRLPILEEMAKLYQETFYSLDDNSALMIDGDRMEVVSEGVWKKFN
jgi:dipeptidase E